MPLSHPFVERLIGTIRREFLDQVLFWNARDLERKLADFQAYYNAARGHASLEGHTPLTFAGDHVIAPADIVMKSPGGGIPPYEWDKVIGCTTLKALHEDDFLSYDVLIAPNAQVASS